VKQRTGNRSTTTAPRNAYRTRDGHWVCLSASIQKMTERLLRAIGRPELIADPRFATNSARLAHADELDAIIGAFIGSRTQAENVAFFEKHEVTIGPVYDIAQIVEDPHVIERELVADYPDADMGAFPMHHVILACRRRPARSAPGAEARRAQPRPARRGGSRRGGVREAARGGRRERRQRSTQREQE